MKMLCLLLLAALLVACVPPGLPGPAPTAQPGYLEGKVTIGPLSPVQKAGETPPPPPPEVCTARSIDVSAADGKTLVANVKVSAECTYRVALAPGSYVVNIARTGIDRGTGLPKTVTIAGGQTVQLDVDIDTGIR